MFDNPGPLPLFVVFICFFVFVVELVRRRQLSGKRSFLWLGMAAGMALASSVFFDVSLSPIRPFLDLANPPAVPYLLASFSLLCVSLCASTVISKNFAPVRALTQGIRFWQMQLPGG